MNESDYWLRLEYRLCSEFEGLLENHLRFLWCDGFTPQQYLVDDPLPRVTGLVWICNGQIQDEWEFTLLLPHPVGAPSEIEWSSLLPADSVTRWLAVDPIGKRVEIEPAAAVPDLA